MPSVHFRGWNDFRVAGIELLTGEACGLNMRILCDVTEKGRLLFCKAFALDPKTNKLGEAWNGGPKADPHVGSVMLTTDQLPLLSVFAALDHPGVVECVVSYKDGQWEGTYGFTRADLAQKEEWVTFMERYGNKMRRYGYGGTAGDRNRHEFSGRVT
jgi:hypothetical protein